MIVRVFLWLLRDRSSRPLHMHIADPTFLNSYLTNFTKQVAIKFVDKSSIADIEDVQRVYRETFILTNLRHKNIIRLFEVLDAPNAILLAMEYAGACVRAEDKPLFFFLSQKERGKKAECGTTPQCQLLGKEWESKRAACVFGISREQQ